MTMIGNVPISVFVLHSMSLVSAFPDGAPCLGNIRESMMPDLVAHGQPRNDTPPFEILIGPDCYWSREAINVRLVSTLRPGVRFKGFSLQARQMAGSDGVGQFERDDSAIWQYHCFKSKFAITHANNRKKTEVSVWWSQPEKQSDTYVQFIATVVIDLKMFWVQSVRSKILPPCHMESKSEIKPMSVKYTSKEGSKRPTLAGDNNNNSETAFVLDSAPETNTLTPFIIPFTTTTRHPNARDCKMSKWSEWNSCSISCGLGIQHRTRKILISSRHNGDACGELKQGQSCVQQSCPIPPEDCVMRSWSSWSPCPQTCGGFGTQYRTRSIHKYALGAGRKCANFSTWEQHDCVQPKCIVLDPVKCELSEWTDWSHCSATCGLGTMTRDRYVTQIELNGGTPCETTLTQSNECNIRLCPNPSYMRFSSYGDVCLKRDCELGEWYSWSACSVTCGVGTRIRTRDVLVDAFDGGIPCAHLNQLQSCYDKEALPFCPISQSQSQDDNKIKYKATTTKNSLNKAEKKEVTSTTITTLSANPQTTTTKSKTLSQKLASRATTSHSALKTTTKPSTTRKTTTKPSTTRKTTTKPSTTRKTTTTPNKKSASDRNTLRSTTPTTQSTTDPTTLSTRLPITTLTEVLPPPHTQLVSVWFTLATPKPQTTGKRPRPSCLMRGWSTWSSCSRSCGAAGERKRIRSVSAYLTYSTACPPTMETDICQPDPCPQTDYITTRTLSSSNAADVSCLDISKNCVGWTANCDRDAALRKNCRKSCGLC